MVSYLGVSMKKSLKNSSKSFTHDFVVVTLQLKLQPTKLLEQDTIGPPYSLMCTSLLGIAINVNYLQEKRNLLQYL